ncbi:MAG: hypothetical protein EOO16_15565 [Chitinophagaceae bacterium]|nr:MAG: hypothetical protein EOO16_15565 [Chitinophagaceae bacterium]
MHPLLQTLTDAAAGLYFLSETDAPFVPVQLAPGEGAEDGVRRLAGKAGADPVEIQEAGHFLRNHTRALEGGPEAEARAARFRALIALLQQSLPGLKAYRTGSVQVDAFLLGTLPDGTLGGLRTQMVET